MAYRRAANIVRAEEHRDGVAYDGAGYEPGIEGAGDVETALWQVLARTESGIASALADEAFERAMQQLAELRQPVDAFFDQVTVNVDDSAVRGNRLRLLARIQGFMNNVADFSQVEG